MPSSTKVYVKPTHTQSSDHLDARLQLISTSVEMKEAAASKLCWALFREIQTGNLDSIATGNKLVTSSACQAVQQFRNAPRTSMLAYPSSTVCNVFRFLGFVSGNLNITDLVQPQSGVANTNLMCLSRKKKTWGTLRNKSPGTDYLTAADQGVSPNCKFLNRKMSVVLGRPLGKRILPPPPLLIPLTLWWNLVCGFLKVLKDLETFFFIIVLDLEFPLIPFYLFQPNSSCSHKLRIWPLVSNPAKEDSSTMRQIVLTAFLAA